MLLAFALCIPGFSQKYFEGSVEYDLTVESLNPNIATKQLQQTYGTKVRFYHKDGNYIREYLTDEGNMLHKFIYLVKDNRIYIVDWSNPDTIFYDDASTQRVKKYDVVKGAGDTVLDCICPSRIISYSYFEKMANDTIHVKEEYFFCRQLAINPDYYKKYFIWYDVIKLEKSVAIKFVEESANYFRLTYTATKINNVILPKETFDIDKNAVLKRKAF